MDKEPVIVATAGILVIGFLAWLFMWMIQEDAAEQRQWRAFSVAYDCRLVGVTSGSTSSGYGVGTDGKFALISTYTSGKHGYSCSDGVTYWRDE